jgi:hypothetical protein
VATQTEYIGLDCAVRLDGHPYKVQHLRLVIESELGNLTSGEDNSYRGKPTVVKGSVEMTKASFDPSNSPFATPLELEIGNGPIEILVYPGGVDEGDPFTFPNVEISNFTYENDANMLSPLSLSGTNCDGSDPTQWYPGG